MEESETGEELGSATILVPGALSVKVEYLQGAPWPGHTEEEEGESSCTIT